MTKPHQTTTTTTCPPETTTTTTTTLPPTTTVAPTTTTTTTTTVPPCDKDQNGVLDQECWPPDEDCVQTGIEVVCTPTTTAGPTTTVAVDPCDLDGDNLLDEHCWPDGYDCEVLPSTIDMREPFEVVCTPTPAPPTTEMAVDIPEHSVVTTTTVPADPALPATGSDSNMAIGGSLALLLGIALCIVSTRKRASQ